MPYSILFCFFFFQAEDGIRDDLVTGVQTCALPISPYSDIMSVKLDTARKHGVKILMWHGETDQLIPWRQSVHYYREAAEHFDGYDKLKPWFRDRKSVV